MVWMLRPIALIDIYRGTGVGWGVVEVGVGILRWVRSPTGEGGDNREPVMSYLG